MMLKFKAVIFAAIVAGTLFCRWEGKIAAQAPQDIDEQRAKRYAKELENLVRAREVFRKQCGAIQARQALLSHQFQSQWLQSILAYENMLNTPQFQATPILRGIASSTGRMGRMLKAGQDQNGDLIWCRLQDNSIAKNMLAQSVLANRNGAMAAVNQFNSNREALLEIARQADRNFTSLRSQADWMGRRSQAEHEIAIEIANKSLLDDPRNAGMALVKASALRSLGEFGDADDLLNDIDDYFFQLQVIHAGMRAQCDFVDDHPDRVKKILAEVVPLAKSYGWVEPLLVRGWVSLAMGDYDAAKRYASEAKGIAPEYLEVGLLLAWAIMEGTPRKSDDALEILRDFGVRSSTDDWYYTEALGHASARMENWNQAKKQFEYALETTPSHFQSTLQGYLADIEARRTPKVDWKMRLVAQWKIPRR
jgi:tetratricopeptide (TPR) repeat protein